MSNTDWKGLKTKIPRIILTAGEPSGIGPDIIVKVAQRSFNAELSVIADPDLLMERAGLLGLTLQLDVFNPATQAQRHQPKRINILSAATKCRVKPGTPNTANAAYVLDTITVATEACLRKDFDAMVTAPVNKAVINDGGYPFSGHTEFIAELCDHAVPVMMLMNQYLRVALVTTHLPLSKVSDAITADRLEQVITIVNKELHSRMGIDKPGILVCGLNPHAGENGHLGNEERDIIIPVLVKLHAAGLAVSGPVPADTAFTRDALQGIDAVIAMYHDQGLPVLKSHGFGETVNITLGLPIIRTSVDHGTALTLAGTGKASAGSLQAAIECAIDLVSISRKSTHIL